MTLSEKQLEAIETNTSNLRIIACAGSGKTTTIAKKVAYLLDPKNGFDVLPENIIAFTYTEKAAAELKSRILNYASSQRGMADMYIGTIHGWCLKALQDNEFEYQKYSVLDEIKLRLFVDKNYETIGMKDIHKLGKSNELMRRFVDTSRFIKIMDIVRESDLQTEVPSNISQAKTKYEQSLTSKAYFDFSMIMDKALIHLRSEGSNLRQSIQRKIKYLIVDEYQDVNAKQEQLIHEIYKASSCIITVVGDDDQNIYQWRGSNNKYIIDFDKKYAPSITIPLTVNYRSSKGITAVASSLIDNNQTRIRKEMSSAEKQSFSKNIDILYNQYDSIEEENESIAHFVNSLKGVAFKDDDDAEPRGLSFSDMCILVRTWKKAESIVAALEANNIPYVTAGVNQLFSTQEVKAALGIFEYLNNYITDESELKTLWKSLPFAVYDSGKLDTAIKGLENRRPKSRTDHTGNKVKLTDKEFAYNLQDIFWEFLETAEIFEDAFIDYSNEKSEKSSRERAEIIFYNLGKFSQVIKDFEEVNFSSGAAPYHLFNFLSFINYAAQDYYPEGWINNPFKTPNAVQIMTIHQAKGLEFPAVFIPGLNRNYLPQKRKGGLNEWHFLSVDVVADQERYSGSEEDERRLLYVAITRSQKFLLLSRAPDASNRLYQTESSFIRELNNSDVLFQNRSEKFTSYQKIESKSLEKVRNIVLNFSILKDYFDCPYRFKLVSMFGFAFPLNQRMGLGKSFHNCLMELHKRAQAGEEFSETELSNIITRQKNFPYLSNSEILEKPFVDQIERNLTQYYSTTKSTLRNIAFVEQEIQLKLPNEILVIGRIDLIKEEKSDGALETTIIEFKSDEENDRLRVVNEDQLKLYAMGHQELTGAPPNYIMTYIIGTNEPHANVRHVVTEDDLQNMRLKISNAANQIRLQSFDRITNPSICRTCYQNSLCPHRLTYNVKPIRK